MNLGLYSIPSGGTPGPGQTPMPCPIASITRGIDALALTSRTRARHDGRGNSRRRVEATPLPAARRRDVTRTLVASVTRAQ